MEKLNAGLGQRFHAGLGQHMVMSSDQSNLYLLVFIVSVNSEVSADNDVVLAGFNQRSVSGPTSSRCDVRKLRMPATCSVESRNRAYVEGRLWALCRNINVLMLVVSRCV
jgi:hypothetical protein